MKLLIGVKTCHVLDYYFDDNTVDWLTARGYHTFDQPARVAAMRDTWLSKESLNAAYRPFRIPTDPVALATHIDYKFFYGTKLRRTDIKPNQRPGTELPAPPLRAPLADEVFLPVSDGYKSISAKTAAICQYALDSGYDYLLLTDDDTLVFLDELLKTDFAKYDYSGADTGSFHAGSCIFLSRTALYAIVSSRITSFADDLWIGDVMKSCGIPMHPIAGIRHKFGEDYPARVWNGEVSLHSVTPELMRSIWDQRTTSLSQQQKDMAGPASKITPSPSPSLDSEDEKSSLSVILRTLREPPFYASGSNLSTTPRQEITPSLSGFESSETGLQQTNTTSVL